MKRYLWAAAILLVAGCSKDNDEQPVPNGPTAGATAKVQFTVDGTDLMFDTIRYANAAGNPYSVSRLQFYLSGFVFEASDGSTYRPDDVFYVDARVSSTYSLSFPDFPFGTYTRVTCYVGLDSVHNQTGSLPATVENENMAWPEPMGGGYHFMKLEGNFTDQGSTYGFAMHMGMNGFYATCQMVHTFSVSASNQVMVMEMNINEWFVNPYIYDFNTDGNYSMGNMTAMGKLSANGADVFTIK